ncbi:hypothetical protein GGR56DRAFT_28944 [Xylariaceae sp. FL0804]|nr:hypothetical protein GGR56DRAFT_28944 [Xylariaceae sp. FL0804]
MHSAGPNARLQLPRCHSMYKMVIIEWHYRDKVLCRASQIDEQGKSTVSVSQPPTTQVQQRQRHRIRYLIRLHTKEMPSAASRRGYTFFWSSKPTLQRIRSLLGYTVQRLSRRFPRLPDQNSQACRVRRSGCVGRCARRNTYRYVPSTQSIGVCGFRLWVEPWIMHAVWSSAGKTMDSPRWTSQQMPSETARTSRAALHSAAK